MVKRNKQMAGLKSAFELSLKKMKKPDSLEKTDFVQGEIPVALHDEFEEFKSKNEELPDPELWNTESLSFRYFNTLHQYKATHQLWIEWLRMIKNGPLGDAQMTALEKKCGINLAAFK